MHLLADRGDMADRVIEDLTRWHAWDALDRLIAKFDKPQVPSINEAMVRYALALIQARPGDVSPERLAVAKKYLAEMRKKDPEMVAYLESTFPQWLERGY
jgi:hypothetical protein